MPAEGLTFSFDDLVSGDIDFGDDTRIKPPTPVVPPSNSGVGSPQAASAEPAPLTQFSFDDIVSGRVDVDADQRAILNPNPPQAPQPAGDDGLLDNLANAGLSLATGGSTGVEIAGAILELGLPELGDKVRSTGISMGDYLTQHMTPDWQASINKSVLNISGDNAALDWKWWTHNILNTVPYMLATGVAGEGLALGARAVGAAGRVTAETVGERVAQQAAIGAASRKLGYGAASGIAAGGEAAQGAARATDEAGLPPEERQKAMWWAAGTAAPLGALLGPKLEELLHGAGGTMVGRLTTGALVEGGEEGATQAGTEIGKATVGLGSVEEAATNIFESMVGGGLIGAPAGALASRKGAKNLNAQKEEEAGASAEAQAILAEANRLSQEEVAGGQQTIRDERARIDAAPKMLPAPEPGTTPPVDVGAEQFTGQPPPNFPGVPPSADPTGAVGSLATEAMAAPDLFLSEEGKVHYQRLSDRVDTLGAELDQVRTTLETGRPSEGERITLKKKFRDRKAAYDIAVRVRDDFVSKQEKMRSEPRQQKLPGIVEAGTPEDINHAAVAAMDASELEQELDKWFGPGSGGTTTPNAGYPEPSTPFEQTPFGKRLARSDAARRGHLTRQANKVATTGPHQPITPETTATPSTSLPTGSAEQQAIRGHQAANAGSPSDDSPAPTPAVAGPPQIPAPPGGTADIAQGQAPPSPGLPPSPTPPPAAVGGPAEAPAPGGPVQPTADPHLPQPQRGGVTLPPTSEELIEEPDPAEAEYAAPYRRDPTSVVGSAPPSPFMPQVEAALTQPKKTPSAKREKTLREMTPGDRLRYILSAGPQPIDKVLAHLQDALAKSGDPRWSRLVSRLRLALPKHQQVVIGNKLETRPLGIMVESRDLSQGFQGLYDPRVNRIYVDLNKAESPVTAVLHEAVHAALAPLMRTNKAFARDIERIMKDAVRSYMRMGRDLPLEGDAAFYDPEEFIARILTDFEMNDQLASTPATIKRDDEEDNRSVWQRFKNRIGVVLGMNYDPGTRDLFSVLLEFIPDGKLLQDGNMQEMMTQMANLGLDHPLASLTSTYRALLRQTSTFTGKKNQRVWNWLLPGLTGQQIAISHGDLGKYYTDPTNPRNQITLGDYINKLYRLQEEKDGYSMNLRAVGDQIIGVGKQAAQAVGSTKNVDDVLIDARRWQFDVDLPVTDPINAVGASAVGGDERYRHLRARFDMLSNQQKDFYRLIRDNSQAQWMDFFNKNMIWRVRARMETASPGAGDLIEQLIYHPSRGVVRTTAGIDIAYAKPLNKAELDTFVAGLTGVTPAQAKQLRQDLKQVEDAMGKAAGIYVPLRRSGSWYTMLRSPETVHAPMTKAAFATMVNKSQLHEGGELEVLDEGLDPATGMYSPKTRHVVVDGHDSETDAREHLDHIMGEWRRQGIPIERSVWAPKSANLFETLGFKSTSVATLRNFLETELTAKIGSAAGKAASDMALTYYLEKLPESSTRKSQLHAKRTAGASRDMMHVYSQYVNGAAYLSAQMTYGHQISRMLNTSMSDDIKKIQTAADAGRAAGRAQAADKLREQAADYKKVQEFYKFRDTNYDRLASKDATELEGKLLSMWKRVPQLTGAWLLTGPGTIISNALQTWGRTLPYFGARKGYLRSARDMWQAYKDVFAPITGEMVQEYKRAFNPKALATVAKVAAGRGRFVPEIKNPAVPMYERVARRLDRIDPKEGEHIRQLTLRKKIDFGLSSDVKSLAERSGGKWMATQYMMDTAFIAPQAVEMTNRVVTGLVSYRQNKTAVTVAVMHDAAIPAGEKANVIQQRLLDLAADAIDASQVNYGAANRPTAFQHEVLRQALVFKTYPQAIWYDTVHNTLQAMQAKTPEERKIARKYIAGMFATTVIPAGLMGLVAFDPFYLAAVALTALFTDDDDPESALRDALNDWMSEDWVDMLTRGMPYAFGVADMSNRLGMPTMFPLEDLFKIKDDPSKMYSSIAGVIGEAMMGAPGSIIGKTVMPAAAELANGNYAKGVEHMAPKAFGLNDIIQAWNYHNQGIVDTRGEAFVKPKDLAYGDLVRRALGFDAPGISEKKQVRRRFFAEDMRLNDKRDALIASFAEAQLARDKSARADALTEIKHWNTQNGRKGYGITRDNVMQSLTRRRKGEYLVAKYGVKASTPGQRKLLKDIQAQYQ